GRRGHAVKRGAALPDRLAALREAFDAARGRIAPDVEDRIDRILSRVDGRLAFSGDVTVVALAGATGSGKSSLFNALSGTSLAEPGVRRPTTAVAMAAVFGEEQGRLLDWLDIPRRHLLPDTADLSGLVLLDLPDHDSTQRSHREVVDRLVELVDQFVWVVDPQKYADAALHDRYLRPLAAHADVMVVVLNQVDRVAQHQRAGMVSDLRRLLDEEGLGQARLLAVSALTGEGLGELRRELAALIAGKQTAARRLAGDVSAAAEALAPQLGAAEVDGVPPRRAAQLNTTLAVAAGVPVVVEAVKGSWRHRGGLATGWPVVAWLARLRPDPLRRLHLDMGRGKRKAIEPGSVNRTSLPVARGVAKARVDSAVRALATETAEGLPRGWQDAVLAAARSEEAVLPDHLDRAISTTDLGTDRGTAWWSVVRVLQWLVLGATLVGAGWLLVNFLLVSYLALPALPVPKVGNLGLPTVLALGGVLAGILVALLSRVGVEIGARTHGARAQRALTRAISEVTSTYVTGPVDEELARRTRAREALKRLH
ncbi:MAG TPA: YfjP family GTPase, partial [Propionibacteriaceae bacterium]|nr:YfjP family GTPase [Propionibacteriaceae bacterium]